jgi:hypothetical protein
MNDNETLAFRHGSFDPHGTFFCPLMWSGVGAMYEGESNENRKNFFKFNLLNESGTQLYNFST